MAGDTSSAAMAMRQRGNTMVATAGHFFDGSVNAAKLYALRRTRLAILLN
jgi:hypothetical protein